MTAKAPKGKDLDQLEDQHIDAVHSLADNCMEITYEVSGLPGNRSASDGTRNKMVETVSGKKNGYSISKRLFCSKHPLIKEFNAARRKLDQWRDSFVIVKAAEQATDQDGREKITAGVRLILAKDIPEFEQGFRVRVDEYYAAADVIEKHMKEPYSDGKKDWPSILDSDKEVLGDDFNLQDYPKKIRDCVRVLMPTYAAYHVSLKLPAEVRKRQEERIAEALSGTLETATSYICETLTEIFTQFANQLVNRTRLYPDKEGPLGAYHGAELVKLRTHDDDDEVPKGKVIVIARYKTTVKDVTEAVVDPDTGFTVTPAAENSKEITATGEIGLFGEGDDYEKRLKPQTTEERKSLTKSTLDNLFEQLNTVSKVKEMLGPYGASIETTVDKIRTLMTSAGKTPESVLGEAKNSKFFRDKFAAALKDATAELSETVETAKKVRRKINPKLIGLGG